MQKVPGKFQKKLVNTVMSADRESKWLGDSVGNLLFTVLANKIFKLNEKNLKICAGAYASNTACG